MDPFHIFIRGECFLNTDDISCLERLDPADPDHGSVGGQYCRIDLPHLLQSAVIL